jgi:sterol desaturase/sphingolipid hydroxylase (fatty acid hydroxylase superfamily)
MSLVFAILVSVLSAVLLIPILDYGWHAWVGHGPKGLPTRADHFEHHRTANALGAPWVEIRKNAVLVTVVAIGVGVVLSWFMGPMIGATIALSWWIGYGAITFSHARMHQRAPRTKWEQWFWRFHFHHHYGNPRVNFGLTTPWLDYLFRTIEVPEVVLFPEYALPAWWQGEGMHPGFGVRRKG